MTCLCSLQPYSTKHLTPQDIMEFPWEIENSAAAHIEKLTAEEERERYRAARRRLGLK